ncbi:hypothetical protein MKW94_009741 [Papaver nudicaule]|uniref:Uncharacterized protein n=1 Tax=Papaver nudicaule TaxID=74823 RepID=A0AA41VMQ9_PAPNU|nr:hypothetical protein [Papaver nudicaule]
MNEENPPTTTTSKKKKESLLSDNNNGNIINPLFGKGKFKFWVLAAIVLLAFCSIFTGTITLKWSSSSGILNHFSLDDDFINSPILDDLDVLEIEEREKIVKHMWDAYTHTSRIVLPKFWRRAFEAGYQDLVSDDLTVRNSAVSEIAKMSIRSFINLDPPPDPIQPKNGQGGATDKMNAADKGDGGRKMKNKVKSS